MNGIYQRSFNDREHFDVMFVVFIIMMRNSVIGRLIWRLFAIIHPPPPPLSQLSFHNLPLSSPSIKPFKRMRYYSLCFFSWFYWPMAATHFLNNTSPSLSLFFFSLSLSLSQSLSFSLEIVDTITITFKKHEQTRIQIVNKSQARDHAVFFLHDSHWSSSKDLILEIFILLLKKM